MRRARAGRANDHRAVGSIHRLQVSTRAAALPVEVEPRRLQLSRNESHFQRSSTASGGAAAGISSREGSALPELLSARTPGPSGPGEVMDGSCDFFCGSVWRQSLTGTDPSLSRHGFAIFRGRRARRRSPRSPYSSPSPGLPFNLGRPPLTEAKKNGGGRRGQPASALHASAGDSRPSPVQGAAAQLHGDEHVWDQ